ncbi:MAG TPA: hemerythrin domain-containing protein [Polyangiaceae bacterium]|nr:hemerythrin domain-containing protein [Polyangiaceae bacterium]
MDLFDTLIDDHRLISRVLFAFEGFLTRVEQTGDLDPIELNRFVVFFREFADLIHHDREERVLFPAMKRLGYAPNGAPIAHVMDEHRREQKLLFELRQGAVRNRPRGSRDTAHLVGVSRELVLFEREHIKKENDLLYPAVKKEFSGKTLDSVTKELWAGDDSNRALVEDAWLRSLAVELVSEHAPGK